MSACDGYVWFYEWVDFYGGLGLMSDAVSKYAACIGTLRALVRPDLKPEDISPENVERYTREIGNEMQELETQRDGWLETAHRWKREADAKIEAYEWLHAQRRYQVNLSDEGGWYLFDTKPPTGRFSQRHDPPEGVLWESPLLAIGRAIELAAEEGGGERIRIKIHKTRWDNEDTGRGCPGRILEEEEIDV